MVGITRSKVIFFMSVFFRILRTEDILPNLWAQKPSLLGVDRSEFLAVTCEEVSMTPSEFTGGNLQLWPEMPILSDVPQMGAGATEPLAPEAKFPGGACGPGPLSHYSGMNPIAGIPPSPVAPRQRRGSIVLTSPQVSPS